MDIKEIKLNLYKNKKDSKDIVGESESIDSELDSLNNLLDTIIYDLYNKGKLFLDDEGVIKIIKSRQNIEYSENVDKILETILDISKNLIYKIARFMKKLETSSNTNYHFNNNIKKENYLVKVNDDGIRSSLIMIGNFKSNISKIGIYFDRKEILIKIK